MSAPVAEKPPEIPIPTGSARTLRFGSAARTAAAIVCAFLAFLVFLVMTGRDPIDVYQKAFTGTLGSWVGLSEVGVRTIPFVLTALAAALPGRVGLINVGAEGQFELGAWAATAVALTFGDAPAWILLPLMTLAGFAGGGAWAAIAVLLKRWRGVNEVISTLLLNYVAVLFVDIFVFGPWKDPNGFNYPYTPTFSAAGILPSLGGTRFHLGFIIPLIAVAVMYVVLRRTRWGFAVRAVGGNPEAAKRQGIPVGRYLVLLMLIGGGLAGIAGMVEVSGVQHHLRPGISANLGYLGFLASWLAGHNPIGIIGTGFLIALIVVGGDLLQFSANLPAAASNVLIGLILFLMLGFRERKAGVA